MLFIAITVIAHICLNCGESVRVWRGDGEGFRCVICYCQFHIHLLNRTGHSGVIFKIYKVIICVFML